MSPAWRTNRPRRRSQACLLDNSTTHRPRRNSNPPIWRPRRPVQVPAREPIRNPVNPKVRGRPPRPALNMGGRIGYRRSRGPHKGRRVLRRGCRREQGRLLHPAPLPPFPRPRRPRTRAKASATVAAPPQQRPMRCQFHPVSRCGGRVGRSRPPFRRRCPRVRRTTAALAHSRRRARRFHPLAFRQGCRLKALPAASPECLPRVRKVRIRAGPVARRRRLECQRLDVRLRQPVPGRRRANQPRRNRAS